MKNRGGGVEIDPPGGSIFLRGGGVATVRWGGSTPPTPPAIRALGLRMRVGQCCSCRVTPVDAVLPGRLDLFLRPAGPLYAVTQRDAVATLQGPPTVLL